MEWMATHSKEKVVATRNDLEKKVKGPEPMSLGLASLLRC